ncbi:uncharacterized protein EI90DRAFT_3059385 [Cantharellus anzutake]|uniref:uncharacterized protein n=1 Tax=Cantharellus anzutake TaxID=1750568 RepID=UPI001903A72A|nr:uncharacterized protein EI90DRAFT_3059385 [Cantharellus anzutake]KAF8330822.1 hypothetical protein EI90DRAFT_3059385 [Cantharellus anzutake]
MSEPSSFPTTPRYEHSPERPPGIERIFGELEEASPPNVHRGRTLILCFDGVADELGERNTNVVHLFSCLEKSHPNQLLYYQTGIGTYTTTGTQLGKWMSEILDQGAALHLKDHVCGGYRFLQSNWKEGDKICFFGFSRGAYIARALAGMLHTVGLLPASMPEQVEIAYKLYKDSNRDATSRVSKPGWKYKRDFCRVVKIDFLGAWDTVSSVGILVSRTLPFSQSNTSVIVFRHAMALDERRARFIPLPWRLSGIVKERRNEGWEHHASNTRAINSPVSWAVGFGGLVINIVFSLFIKWWLCHIMDRLGYHSGNGPKRALIPEEGSPPDVKEVWFAGGHGGMVACLRPTSPSHSPILDVGGGNELDDKPRNEFSDKDESMYSPALANIPLRWMIHELHKANKKYCLNVRWRPIRLAHYGVLLPEIPYTNDDRDLFGRHPTTSADKAGLVIGSYPSSTTDGSRSPVDEVSNPNSPPPDVGEFIWDAAEEEQKNHPRRAKFLRYRVFSSGVIYDQDFAKKDLAAPAYDELWKWDECTFDGIMSMLLWWFLELTPSIISVQNKHTFLWESRLRFNFFRPRYIPRGTTPDVYEGTTLSDSWVKFLGARSKPRYHWSVRERMKIKPDYRPRPWRADENIEEDWIEAAY